MKILLIKSFKNHPAGSVLDVSKRIYNLLRERGCVPDPRPLKFTEDVPAAADKVEPKKKTRKKTKAKED